jgi:hypothetical protein
LLVVYVTISESLSRYVPLVILKAAMWTRDFDKQDTRYVMSAVTDGQALSRLQYLLAGRKALLLS